MKIYENMSIFVENKYCHLVFHFIIYSPLQESTMVQTTDLISLNIFMW